MKGHKENCQRRNGGSTKMRDMGGFKAPRMGENEHVMKEAKGKTTGIVKMDGPDGDVAKKRLDRPGRKHGGHVKHKEHREAEHKHGGHVKEHHAKHHEKHEHEEHHKHGGHVKKK